MTEATKTNKQKKKLHLELQFSGLIWTSLVSGTLSNFPLTGAHTALR